MATRQERRAEAMRKHVEDCQARTRRNVVRNAARNGTGCRECSGSGVRQQRMKGADGSIFTVPQPCHH